MEHQEDKKVELVNPWWLPVEELPKIAFDDNTPNACKNCPNNPKNGGSGICHCVLGMSGVYC